MGSVDSFILYRLQICASGHKENILINLHPEISVGRERQVIFPFCCWECYGSICKGSTFIKFQVIFLFLFV